MCSCYLNEQNGAQLFSVKIGIATRNCTTRPCLDMTGYDTWHDWIICDRTSSGTRVNIWHTGPESTQAHTIESWARWTRGPVVLWTPVFSKAKEEIVFEFWGTSLGVCLRKPILWGAPTIFWGTSIPWGAPILWGAPNRDRDPDRIEPQILRAPRIPRGRAFRITRHRIQNKGAPIQNPRQILLCVALAIAVPHQPRRAESVHKRQERQETVGETLVLRKGGMESNYVDGLDVGVARPSHVLRNVSQTRACPPYFLVPCRAVPSRAVPCRAVQHGIVGHHRIVGHRFFLLSEV